LKWQDRYSRRFSNFFILSIFMLFLCDLAGRVLRSTPLGDKTLQGAPFVNMESSFMAQPGAEAGTDMFFRGKAAGKRGGPQRSIAIFLCAAALTRCCEEEHAHADLRQAGVQSFIAVCCRVHWRGSAGEGMPRSSCPAAVPPAYPWHAPGRDWLFRRRRSGRRRPTEINFHNARDGVK